MNDVEVISSGIVEVAIASSPVVEVEVAPLPTIEIEVLPGGIVYRGEETTSLSTNSYEASTNLSALRVVIVNDDGKLEYASSDRPEHSFMVVGVLKDALTQGNFGKALVQGLLSDSFWSWTLGVPIYVGEDGVLTQSPPSEGFQLVIGKPVTPSAVYFEIGEPILL